MKNNNTKAVKNYANIIKEYKSLCNKIYAMVSIALEYCGPLINRVSSILEKEDDDEDEEDTSTSLSDANIRYLKSIYDLEEDDNEVTGIFEKLGFKDIVDDSYMIMEYNHFDKEDFTIDIRGIDTDKKTKYIEVSLVSNNYPAEELSFKLPLEYLQGDYKKILKDKYNEINTKIDKILKARDKRKAKAGNIKDIKEPNIELKKQLVNAIKGRCFKSEKEACTFIDNYAKSHSSAFKEHYINCVCENNRAGVIYRDKPSLSSDVKLFTIPLTFSK